MKFDSIVTERGQARLASPWTKLLVAAPLFGLAFYLAGDRTEAESATQEPANASEVVLIAPQAAPSTSRRSILTDLTPIANADAAVRFADEEPVQSADFGDMGIQAPELVAGPQNDVLSTSQTPADADRLAVQDPQLTRLEDKVIEVKRGDSLSLLFDRHKLATADWMRLAKMKGEARRLLKLRPGDKLKLGLDTDGRVAALDMRLDDLSSLKIRRSEDGQFEQSISKDKVDIVQKRVAGTIENSLFLSAKAAGLSDKLTMELTEIFAWDVDFALDIRSGDQFELLFEEVQKDGKRIKDGRILAAEFTNRGKAIQAVYYAEDDSSGAYYSPDGKPMKKAFLRSPVDFTRISSRFSLGRKHPILNRIRAHKGVDYAAPRGTPIRAAGSGKVIFAGNKGGYGRVVILQHAGKYQTLYAHMKSFRRGIKRGKSVAQGETIGYVGSSGLATGPHLHYEFQVGGRHVDPLRVKLPSAPAIAKAKLDDFRAQTQPILASLKGRQDRELAAAQTQ